MKTLLNKQQQINYLDENWRNKTQVFKWTTSQARDTYGYNICTLRDARDSKLSSTCGGGYDMQGKAFGEFINQTFPEELKRINSADFYGLTHYNRKTRKMQKFGSKHTNSYVDGACGFNCMQKIIAKIGFDYKFITENKTSKIYVLEPLPRGHYYRRIRS